MTQPSERFKPDRRQLSRRRFLKVSGRGAVGITGILATGKPPAFAATRELTVLVGASFVPATDKELKRQLDEWGAQSKVNVRLDTIAHLQLASKTAAEVLVRSGHDIMNFGPGLGGADLYFDHLADLDDVAREAGAQNGGWVNEDSYTVRGRWKLLPWWIAPFAMVYRQDILRQLDESVPDTWEEWLGVGKKAKTLGHPLGIPLSHGVDATVTLLSIMWCYGASYVAKDGKTLTIDSPQTREAMAFVKQLYDQAMTPEVLAWDDASNNRCLIAGKCFAIHNPISAYEIAKTRRLRIPGGGREIHEVVDHVIIPQGPRDRRTTSGFWSLGVWSFSKNVELAKDFLRFHLAPEQQHRWVEAGHGFNTPLLRNLAKHPVYRLDPQYRFMPEIARHTVPFSWPGPANAASELTVNLYVIPDMFTQYVTGKMTRDEAIAWARTQLQEIYAGRRKRKP